MNLPPLNSDNLNSRDSFSESRNSVSIGPAARARQRLEEAGLNFNYDDEYDELVGSVSSGDLDADLMNVHDVNYRPKGEVGIETHLDKARVNMEIFNLVKHGHLLTPNKNKDQTNTTADDSDDEEEAKRRLKRAVDTNGGGTGVESVQRQDSFVDLMNSFLPFTEHNDLIDDLMEVDPNNSYNLNNPDLFLIYLYMLCCF